MPNDGDNGPSELSRYDRRELMKLAGLTGVGTVGGTPLATGQASTQASNFEILDLKTNSPVSEGKSLDISYTIKNTGESKGTQTITAGTPDLPESDSRSSLSYDVTLDPGGERDISDTVQTNEGDAGEYEVVIETENDTDTTTVVVNKNDSEGRNTDQIQEELDSLVTNSKEQLEDSTDLYSKVYSDGYKVAIEDDNKTDPDDLPGMFALGLNIIAASDPKKEAAEEIATYVGDTLINAGLGKLVKNQTAEAIDEMSDSARSVLQNCLGTVEGTDILDDFDNIGGYPGDAEVVSDELKASDPYQTAVDNIENNYSIDDAVIDEEAELNEIAEILNTQSEIVSPGDNYIPIVYTPTEQSIHLGKTAYHKSRYDYLKDEYNTGKKISLVYSVIGNTIGLIGTATSATGLGLVVAGAGQTITQLGGGAETIALNYLIDQWARTTQYWAMDLCRTDNLSDVNSVWLEDQLENPDNLSDIDGAITDLTADKISDGTIQLSANYKNTGSVDARPYVLIIPVVEGEITEEILEPREIPNIPTDEEDEITVGYEYISEFEGSLEELQVRAVMYLNGKQVDTQTIASVPGIEQDVGASSFTTSSDSQRHSAYVTPDGVFDSEGSAITDLQPETTDVIDTEVSPDSPKVETTYSTSTGTPTERVRLVMTRPPGKDMNLYVEEGADLVGYDKQQEKDVVEITGAEYSGSGQAVQRVSIQNPDGRTFNVRVEGENFITDSPASVQVYAAEVPDRPPVVYASNDDRRPNISVASQTERRHDVVASEVSKQADAGTVKFIPTELTDVHGNTLEEAGIDVNTVGDLVLEADGREVSGITVDVSGEVDLPDVPETEYTGGVTVNPDSTESVTLDVSVLLLDTPFEEVSMLRATEEVNGVKVENTSVSDGDLPSVDGDEVNVVSSYSVESSVTEGSSEEEFELSFGNVDGASDDGFVVLVSEGSGDGWTEPEYEAFSSSASVVLSGGFDGELLLASANQVSGELSPDNPFGDKNNEPLGEIQVVQRLVNWNNDGRIDGESYGEIQIVQHLVEWNNARE